MSSTLINTQHEPAASPLGAINQHFHQHYANRKRYFQNKISRGDVLLIIRMDNRLVTRCGNDIHQYPVNGEVYHQLKALAHSTMAAYYSLLHTPLADAIPLLRNWLPQMQAEAAPDIARAITATIGQLLNEIEQSTTIGHLQIQDYAQKLEPMFAQLLMRSAEDEVTQLHHQLSHIANTYRKAASDTFFIVFGGPQARSRELAKLVFSQWCNDTDDLLLDTRHHVRYLEGGTTVTDATDLIATVMADRELAQTFLGRAEGLEQDVLGLAAEKVIQRCWADLKARS